MPICEVCGRQVDELNFPGHLAACRIDHGKAPGGDPNQEEEKEKDFLE
jgi:hypothetical protein